MTTKLEQAATMALEALSNIAFPVGDRRNEAVTALREALSEQVGQEPVAWANPHDLERLAIDMKVRACGCPLYTVPLYAAPFRTKDLMDGAIWEILETHPADIITAIRAVIAADREKNK